jgi:hypothetical protein
VIVGDVFETLKRSPGAFDLILLDVDNGPQSLAEAKNQRLYGDIGVRTCRAALRPGGILVVWSCGPSARYVRKLKSHGFEVDVRRLAGDLEKQGIPAGKRAEVVHAARSRWQRERDEMLAEVVAARRDNKAHVADARRAFTARLTHEAWHAYATRRLVATGRRPLPPWLDEGLAQVFETVPLEAGELRLDAPDPVRLKALEELLTGRDAPPLVDLLRAGQSQFLIGHGGGRKASQQSYLMAWGLGFHLAVLEPVLTPTSLAAICEPVDAADESARVVEFERLVGMPIAEFDADWRRRMLALRPR